MEALRPEEFQFRTIWSSVECLYGVFKEMEPIPQFRSTAKLGEFLDARVSQSF